MLSSAVNAETYFLDDNLDGQTIFNQGQAIDLYDTGGPIRPYESGEYFEVTFSVDGSACDDVIPLLCGETISSSTFGEENTFDNNFYSTCGDGSDYDGRDQIYSFQRSATGEINYIALNQYNIGLAGQDLEVFIFSDCQLSGGEISPCLSLPYNNNGYLNPAMNVIEFTDQEPGTYYIVIDSKTDQGGGNYSLTISCDGFDCDLAESIICSDPLEGEIDNEDINNNSGYSFGCVTIGNNPNPSDLPNGMFTSGEDYYKFVAPNTGDFEVVLDIPGGQDLELFIFKSEDCCEVFNPFGGDVIFVATDPIACNAQCITGSTGQPGQGESIFIENLNEGEEVIIVVDGFLGAQGQYILEVKCNNLDCTNGELLSCGEVIYDNNFTAENNVEEYCDNLDVGFTMEGPEVVYEFNPGFENRASFYLTNPNGQDLDMFLLEDCNPSNCAATSDNQSPLAMDLISNVLLNTNNTYYLVVDADDPVETSYVLNVNCGYSCIDIPSIDCGIIEGANEGVGFQITNSLTFYRNLTQAQQPNLFQGEYLSEYNAPEVVYSFTPSLTGDYTFNLELEESVEMDVLVALECTGQSNIFDVIGNSQAPFPNGTDNMTLTLNGGQTYTVIVDARGGTAGPLTSGYTLTITGCEADDFCDFVIPYPEDDEDYIPYVLFEDDQLPNNVDSFTINFPLDTIGNGDYIFSETILPNDNGDLEYICPEPGCYFICFWYENEQGELESCCIKYCAEFPVDDCSSTPQIVVVDENEETSITECYFECPPDITLGLTQNILNADSTFISVTGNGIDTTLADGSAGTILLPNGQYEVCCWEYDEACDYWSICCETYCLPYIDPMDQCIPIFENVAEGRYSTDFGINFPKVSPEASVSTPIINGVMVTQIDFTDFGTYRVCYDYLDPIDESCCEYICYEPNDTDSDKCFSIEYKNDTTVQLTCIDDDVLFWNWIALCPPPGDCVGGELQGNGACFEIPQYDVRTEFQICKNYEGCCGQIEVCCDTICYNPYEPYESISDGGNQFIECDDIEIDSFFIDADGDISGQFIYTGPGATDVDPDSSYWEIITLDNPGSPSIFEMDKKGSNKMIFNTQDIGPDDGDEYDFEPGDDYIICFSYIEDDGCREYCCIKIEIPDSCDDQTPVYTGTDGSLDYSYTIDDNLSGQVQGWYISDGGIISGNGDVIDVQYTLDGTYTICNLVYDELTKCYKLCCETYCITNPFSCNEEIAPTNNGDGSWDLDPFDIFVNNAMWQIDLPEEYAGIILPEDVHNFDPTTAPYNIPAGEILTISVKYIDPFTGCTRICCDVECFDQEGDCAPDCYDSCCDGVDNSWIATVIDDYDIFCDTGGDFNDGVVFQVSVLGVCQYHFLRPSPFMSLGVTFDVYSCDGSFIETINTDLTGQYSNLTPVWTCDDGFNIACEDICPNPTEIYCEDFIYLPSGLLSENLENWTQIGSVDQENAVSVEGGGVLLIVDEGHARYTVPFDNATQICFSLNLTGEEETLSNASFTLMDEANNEIRVDLYGWESSPIASNVRVLYNGVSQLGPINIVVDNEPFDISLTWVNGVFSIKFNNIVLATQSFSQIGSISSFDVISFGGNNGNQSTTLSNLCFKSCEGCDDDFTFDAETFTTCGDLVVTTISGVTDNSAVVGVTYSGTEIDNGQGFDIYEVVDGEPVLQGSNDTGVWDCETDRDYLFCYKYLDDDGCIQYCCVKVRIPTGCQDITPNYVGEDNSLAYTYTYEGSTTVDSWFINNQSVEGGTTSDIIIYPAPGTYYACCLVYNPMTQCYEICCRKVCVEGPLDCADVIDENFQVSTGTFDLMLLAPNATIIRWQIDLPLAFTQEVTDPSIFDPTALGIPEGTTITISVTYIDSDGCTKVCCKPFCSSGPGNCNPVMDPCTETTEVLCETFENYNTGDDVDINADWVSSGESCIIAEETNGNKYLEVEFNGTDCDAQYVFPQNTSDLFEINYRVWIPVNSGLAMNMVDVGGLQNDLQINFIAADVATFANIRVGGNQLTSGNNPQVGDDYQELDYPLEEWFDIRVIQDFINGTVWIYIDGNAFAEVENAGLDRLFRFEVSSALTANGQAGVDDLCYNVCGGCENEFIYDPEVFESCDDISIISLVNNTDGTTNITVNYTGTEMGSIDIFEVDGNNLIELDSQSNTSANYNCQSGSTYLFCFKYLDKDGCIQYCCIKVTLPASCGIIVPTFTGSSSNLTFSYSYESSGDDVVEGWFTIDGYVEGETTGSVSFTMADTYTVCCLLWDQTSQCYTLCCKTFCVEDPNECGDIIVGAFDVGIGIYDLTVNTSDATILSWQIDAPSDFAGPIDNPDAFSPAALGIPEGTLLLISVTYIDQDGCTKVCCDNLCSSGPDNCDPCEPTPPDCDLFTVDEVELADGYGFDFDDDNQDEIKINTFITEPDGNVVTQSGFSNMYVGDQEGTYVFCRLYRDECNISYECCDTICVLEVPLDCSSDITVSFTDDTTAVFTHMISGGASYVWNFGDGTILEGSSSPIIHVYPNAPASYTAALTVTDACGNECEKSVDVTVVVETEDFTVVPITEDVSCLGFEDGSINLIISGGTMPYEIDWLNGPDGEIIWEDLSPGEYIVTVSDSGGEDIMLTINIGSPTAPVALVDVVSTTCGQNDGEILVSIQNVVEISDVILRLGDDIIASNELGAFSGLVSGMYAIDIIYGENCVITVNADVMESEDFLLSLNDLDINCETTVTLTTGLESEGFTFIWMKDGETIEEETSSSLVVTSSGDYSVTVDNGSCVKTSTSTINFVLKADITVEAQNTTCGEDNGLIILASNNDVGISTILSNGQMVSTNGLVDLPSGAYDLTITDENGCETKITIMIEESTLPEIIVDATNAGCGNADGTILITTFEGVEITSIQNDDTGEVVDGNSLSSLMAGDYLFTVTDETGCSQPVFESIESEADFSISLGEDLLVCANENMVFTTGVDYAGTTYEWYLDSDLVGEESEYLPTQPGEYVAVVTDSQGCIDEDTIMVFYYPTLIEIDGESGEFFIGESVTYTVLGAESIQWTSDDISLPCSDCEEFNLEILDPGELTLTATDVNGCLEETTFVISVDNELIFPNYITPNGDGINDVLEIEGVEQISMPRLVVFNKWGQVVADIENYQNDWKGTDRYDNELPDGAYYYSLDYTIGESNFQKVSDLTILKNQ
jgi:gliding motility-associated-like protein